MGKMIDRSERDDRIQMNGIVIENSNGLFVVRLDNTEKDIICKPSGKIRQNKIAIVAGDKVCVEMSPYDLTKGRITRRL